MLSKLVLVSSVQSESCVFFFKDKSEKSHPSYMLRLIEFGNVWIEKRSAPTSEDHVPVQKLHSRRLQLAVQAHVTRYLHHTVVADVLGQIATSTSCEILLYLICQNH